ncbi:MAG: arylcarboxylate reductase component [Alphaproteobacteria bacterium]|nr:arylcarboxylate reductase component [Alphaproteobacteria bacterium]
MKPSTSSRPVIAGGASLDDWVCHIVDIHFHPAHGAPFWIERAKALRIDARRDIRGYQDLSLLGFFPIDALRTGNVLDFLPAGVAADPSQLSVHETGGTTGAPARIAAREFFEPINAFMDWFLDEIVGFPRGGNWLFVGPTGPHAVAQSTRQIARTRGGMCYFVDLDPRFIRMLFQRQDMATAALYLEHVRRQTFAILETQPIDVLGTTPVLIQALAPALVERGHRFSGMMYGGTQLGKDLVHLLQTEFFPETVHTAVYGNTLMGGAFLAPVSRSQPDIAYYSVEPLVKIDIVDPGRPEMPVGLGETGQVCVTVLSEERFLPRLLERDQAERWPVHPALGWEGVANVRPLAQVSAEAEGVY